MAESTRSSRPRVGRYFVALTLGWTLLAGASLGWNLWLTKAEALSNARTQARIAFQKDVLYRRWNALRGGLYAPVSAETEPNPYLQIPERDIATPSGHRLTKVNPAYMTRQVHELGAKELGVLGHITSLKPLRPENKPDPWEEAALRKLHQGAEEISETQVIQGKQYLRLMQPLVTEAACLACHAKQGYKVGEIRGGISVSIPLQPVLVSLKKTQRAIMATHFLLWVVVLLGLLFGERKLRRRVVERDRAYQKMEAALHEKQVAMDQVKQLRGLLPICARCKKIRNDEGYWTQIEEHITKHSNAEFSHGICPTCMEELYPEIAAKLKDKK